MDNSKKTSAPFRQKYSSKIENYEKIDSTIKNIQINSSANKI
jgi:hypothetical protein